MEKVTLVRPTAEFLDQVTARDPEEVVLSSFSFL
jgi:hypothetical protein